MGQECTSPEINQNTEQPQDSLKDEPIRLQPAPENKLNSVNPPAPGILKLKATSFSKHNSLITPAPGTCGTAFRRKNRLCAYSDKTHELYEVPYNDIMRLEELLAELGKILQKPVEEITVCHKQVNYNLSCKAFTQRTLKELGIEDNAILSVVEKDSVFKRNPGSGDGLADTPHHR